MKSSDLLKPPPTMMPRALAVWEAVAPGLLESGRLTEEDRGALALYCQFKGYHDLVVATLIPDVIAFSWQTIVALAERLGIEETTDQRRDN